MQAKFYKQMLKSFTIEGLDNERLYQKTRDTSKLALIETEIKSRGVF